MKLSILQSVTLKLFVFSSKTMQKDQAEVVLFCEVNFNKDVKIFDLAPHRHIDSALPPVVAEARSHDWKSVRFRLEAIKIEMSAMQLSPERILAEL